VHRGEAGRVGDVELGGASDYSDIAPGTYSADVRGDDDRSLLTVSERAAAVLPGGAP